MQFLYILLAILGFGLLIFVHELGHFVAARLCHVTVYEFSLGMGPKLVWYESKKTGITYSLRMFPIGGFVSMAGEDDASDDPNALPRKKPWQRLIITAAGGFMNLLLGLVLVLVYVLNTNAASTVVARVDEQKYAASTLPEEQRLLPGDEIVKIDGTRVYIGMELFYEISRKGVEPIDLTVLRDGRELVIENVSFAVDEEDGMEFGTPFFSLWGIEKTPGVVASQTLHTAKYMVKMVFTTVYDLITGRYSLSVVSGPVGAADAMSSVARDSGFIPFLFLLAAISINLGVFNLMPIPALDGFRVLFILIEMIRRKPIPEKYEQAINRGGILVLFGLMILIACKDIIQIFG